MSFPGVVKPSPWPGLQTSSQYHPGHLWHHRHGSLAANPDIAVKRHSPSPSPFRQQQQTPVFRFDNFPNNNEALASSPPPSSLASTPVESVVRIGDNEENTAGVPSTPNSLQLSPTSLARKKRVRRSRCGSCVGCSRKENCGSCSVCTNPNRTNSVCKLKRCEILKRRVSSWCLVLTLVCLPLL